MVTPVLLRLKVMLMRALSPSVGFVRLIALVIMKRMRLQIWVEDVHIAPFNACARWYTSVQEPERRSIVMGHMVPTMHPVVWAHAANPKRRRAEQAVRNFACLPGPASLWTSALGSGDDVAAWPFTVSLLLNFVNSWVACIGRVRLVILGSRVFPT